ncbi:7373_t:CDS:2, partial [Funneliformis geosporum]
LRREQTREFLEIQRKKRGLRVKTKRQGEQSLRLFFRELDSSCTSSNLYTRFSLRNQASSEFRQLPLPIDTHNSPSKNQAPSIIRPVPQHPLRLPPPIVNVFHPKITMLPPIIPPIILPDFSLNKKCLGEGMNFGILHVGLVRYVFLRFLVKLLTLRVVLLDESTSLLGLDVEALVTLRVTVLLVAFIVDVKNKVVEGG